MVRVDDGEPMRASVDVSAARQRAERLMQNYVAPTLVPLPRGEDALLRDVWALARDVVALADRVEAATEEAEAHFQQYEAMKRSFVAAEERAAELEKRLALSQRDERDAVDGEMEAVGRATAAEEILRKATAPRRADGTYNYSREAFEQMANEYFSALSSSASPDTEAPVLPDKEKE